MTARGMLESTFRLLGVLSTGESLSANEANDGLLTFNQMLSLWSNDNLVINQKIREEFTLSPNTATYTWGTGGTFNSARPVEVLEASLKILSADQEIPLKILTTKEYAELSSKNMTSTIPQAVYFDGAYPNQNVTFWFVPSAAEKAVFFSLKPFTELSLNSEISYPPGYEMAMRFNLALLLAPEYGVTPDPFVPAIAASSLAAIKRKNIQSNQLKTDLPLETGKNSFDYRVGE